MAKAELQRELAFYADAVQAAHEAEHRGEYAKAIRGAVRAWGHVEGMLSYRRKYEKAEFDSVPCVDLVLRLAPLIFDSDSLDEMAKMLKERRSVERVTTDDLGERLKAAHNEMLITWLVWNTLESCGEINERDLQAKLAGNEPVWRETLKSLIRMGLVNKRSESGSTYLRLTTDMDELCVALCPACGAEQHVAKSNCLSTRPCTACGTPVVLTIAGLISRVEMA